LTYKKIINLIVILTCILLLIILSIITYQAVTITENWSWSIDFEDNQKTISSYGSLVAGIVGLLSAILLIYTILSQLYQFKKQNKQFKKQLATQENQFQEQFRLQLEQFNEEKRRNEYEERKDMFFKLKLVDTFLISIIVHLKIMAVEMKDYYEFEIEHPLLNNVLRFDVNRDTERLNKMDNLSLFKTFQHFFENESETWVKAFNDLFSIITFYNDLLEELRTNTRNHIKDKYDQKLAISNTMKIMMDKANQIALDYRGQNNRKDSQNYKDNLYYKNVENLIANYNAYLKKNENKESDFNEISQKILSPFLETVSSILQNPSVDEFGIIQLMNVVSSIRKEIYFVRITTLAYARNVENRYKEYFSIESKELKKLEKVQEMIHEKLSKLNLDNI
jgi:hypothetical protein